MLSSSHGSVSGNVDQGTVNKYDNKWSGEIQKQRNKIKVQIVGNIPHTLNSMDCNIQSRNHDKPYKSFRLTVDFLMCLVL